MNLLIFLFYRIVHHYICTTLHLKKKQLPRLVNKMKADLNDFFEYFNLILEQMAKQLYSKLKKNISKYRIKD